MKTIRPHLVYFFPLAILLALGVIFRSFVLQNFIEPLALFFWAILRVLMSIDGEIYWAALIFVTFLAAFRLVPYHSKTSSKYMDIDQPWLSERVGYWKSIIAPARRSSKRPARPREELLNLLVSVLAAQKQANPVDVRNALETRQLLLPANVDVFFFPRSAASGIAWVSAGPSTWLRRLTGQPRDDYRQMEEVIRFIESLTHTEFDHGE